ncbi:MAG: hypothetical protein QOJ76_1293 [Acidobacteriota bacterium]|nr:hypothetical protein [Acidobacteriota bacterium]
MLNQITPPFLAFQHPFVALQNGFNQNLNSWLVIAGFLIIFFCMLAVFVPNIKSVIIRQQEFSGLGVNMKVSILTVFVLMGVLLSMSSFVLQWRGYLKVLQDDQKLIEEADTKIAALNAKLEEFSEREIRTRKFDTTILLKPKGFNGDIHSDEWECEYRLEGPFGTPSEPIHASADSVRGAKFLKAELKGITTDTRLYSFTMKREKKVWACEAFSPLHDAIFDAEEER